MSISFEPRLLPRYLRLDCPGSFTQAFELVREHNCDAVQIDTRAVTGRLPTILVDWLVPKQKVP